MTSPAIILRSKFVTSQSNTFDNYIQYMDREDAKQYVNIKEDSKDNDEFHLFNRYLDYMKDEHKQGNLFTAEDNDLNTEQKKELKALFGEAQKNGSPMWQDVISFDNDWLEEHGIYDPHTHDVDESRMQDIVRKSMFTMLSDENMKDTAIWTASFHYNTNNIHVHIATAQPNPTKEKMKVYDEATETWTHEYRGKRKHQSLEKFKSNVANKIMDRTKEYENINTLIRDTVKQKKQNKVPLSDYKKTKDLFAKAMEQLPNDRRQWHYGYESINDAKPYIDEITNIYLNKFHGEDMEALHASLDEETTIMKDTYGEGSNYQDYKTNKLDDLKKRMGNAVLSEMRNIDQAERHPQHFKRNYEGRRLRNRRYSFQKKAITDVNISMVHLTKAMRKTFHDYQNERHIGEFDRMIDGFEM